jgi:hypothetical protein
MKWIKHISYIALTVFFFYSCKEGDEEVTAAEFTCKALPGFVRDLGFDAQRSAFSTGEKQLMGLVLKEFSKDGIAKTYQHSSWSKAGWLSALQIDRHGNIFVAPAPFISVLDNPAGKQNILYKVDGATQQMTPFIELPAADSNTSRNPFGITGITYNCRNQLLYVASIAGSTIDKENGCLYVIDANSKAIVDKYEGKDLFGLEIAVVDKHLRLLAGSTRTPDIYSFNIDGQGKISSEPETILSLANLGPRGDDKARKIVFNPDESITVSGLEFMYNLIASTERPETVYSFRYDLSVKKWILIQ